MSQDEKRHTFANDPVLKLHTENDERPGVLEPQPDKMQPDVENLPDMSAVPSNRPVDTQTEQQEQHEREAMLQKLNEE